MSAIIAWKRLAPAPCSACSRFCSWFEIFQTTNSSYPKFRGIANRVTEKIGWEYLIGRNIFRTQAPTPRHRSCAIVDFPSMDASTDIPARPLPLVFFACFLAAERWAGPPTGRGTVTGEEN
ncbi:MAG: hypothetical protein EXS32_14425 [Opitutus sp.]|nr:hypothetical protein [Opitutus sp.]